MRNFQIPTLLRTILQLGILVTMVVFAFAPAGAIQVHAVINNDTWQGAYPVQESDLLYSSQVDTTTYQKELDEPQLVNPNSCNGIQLRSLLTTAWYKFHATNAGKTISVDTLGSSQSVIDPNTGSPYPYDTVVAVWTWGTDPTDNLTLIGCNDDTDVGYVSQLGFTTTANTDYYIQVGQYNGRTDVTYTEQPYQGGDLHVHIGFGSQVSVWLGTSTTAMDSYTILPSQNTRKSYDASGGPMKVIGSAGLPLISDIRLQSMVSGTLLDYNESMGIPEGSLSYKYIFPVYENKWSKLDSQIRFANLSSVDNEIKVTIGGVPYFDQVVPANSEKRLSFDASGGPVIVESVDGSTPIIATIRLQCMNAGVLNCYNETPGIPVQDLAAKYYFPVYENQWAPLNSQIRFANLGNTSNEIKVTIGGVPYFDQVVPANSEVRQSFDASGGPVIVESVDGTTPIVATIRLQSLVSGTLLDYNESVGIPESALAYKYTFPTYENKWAPLNSQIRFAHFSSVTTKIRVTIGGIVVWDNDVLPDTEERLSFDASGGPVIVESDNGTTPIVATIRLQCMNAGVLNCYNETPGIPTAALGTKYYFPVYENQWAKLNSQVRVSQP